VDADVVHVVQHRLVHALLPTSSALGILSKADIVVVVVDFVGIGSSMHTHVSVSILWLSLVETATTVTLLTLLTGTMTVIPLNLVFHIAIALIVVDVDLRVDANVRNAVLVLLGFVYIAKPFELCVYIEVVVHVDFHRLLSNSIRLHFEADVVVHLAEADQPFQARDSRGGDGVQLLVQVAELVVDQKLQLFDLVEVVQVEVLLLSLGRYRYRYRGMALSCSCSCSLSPRA